MNTGDTIRQKRLSKKISLRRLADISGVAPSTIYRIERNIGRPHKSTAKALESALDEQKEEACQTTQPTEDQ